MKRLIDLTAIALFALTLWLVTRPADADEYNMEVIVGLHTDHLVEGEANERNEFFALRYHDAVVGTFVNSYHQRTVFAGMQREWEIYPRVSVGGVAGGMWGYCLEALKPGAQIDGCRRTGLPMLAGWLKLEHHQITYRLAVMSVARSDLVGYQFNWRW